MLNNSHKTVGDQGEQTAAETLKARGYRIIERNYRNVFGEMDIIAENNGVICFIEVKTRSGNYYGEPFEAISEAKRRKLTKIASAYLSDKRLDDRDARFDVVSVIKKKEGEGQVEVLKNAFEVA